VARSYQKKRKLNLQPIFDQGDKFVCKTFVAFFLSNISKESHITIIASKKVGNAVKRNLAKRRLREMIRIYLRPNISADVIFLARSFTCEAEQKLLLKDSQNLISKINNTNHK